MMNPIVTAPDSFALCPVCHQSVLPQYYFCPNCGKKLHEAPLQTDMTAQIKLYAFSIVLPMICFLYVTRWQGVRYFKSKDEKAHQIGEIAWALLLLSTVCIIWFTVVWVQDYIQQTVSSINSDFSGM